MLAPFHSKDLEFSFLQTAPGHELLRYVDRVAMTMIKYNFGPKEGREHFECGRQLEEVLFGRNDDAVDIALARICSPRMLTELLKRHDTKRPLKPYEADLQEDQFEPRWKYHDALREQEEWLSYYDRLVLSALSNRVSQSALLGPEPWLASVWTWLLSFGKAGQFSALFQNPDCPRDLVEKVLTHDYTTTQHRREIGLLSAALGCKLISKEPDDDHDYDMAGHRTVRLFWRFMHKAAVDPKAVAALSHNKDNFPNFEVEEELFDLPKYGSPGYDLKKNAGKAFQALVDRFSFTEEERTKKRGQYFNKVDICCGISKSYVRSYRYDRDAQKTVAEHENEGVRFGLYQAGLFGNSNIDACKSFLDKDGFAFCSAALQNPAFYNRRDNAALVQWFVRTLFSGLGSEHLRDENDGGPILEWYAQQAKDYWEREPDVYIDPRLAERVAAEDEELIGVQKKGFWR